MPNWCTNTLTLANEESDLCLRDVILEYLSSNEEKNSEFLDFDKIVPMPKELESSKAPGDNPNWYDWRVENWGTKWNSCDYSEFSEEGKGLVFTTAWSPPIPIIERLAVLVGQDLRLTFYEEGLAFCGELIARGNGMVELEEYDIEDAPSEFLESIGYEGWEYEDEEEEYEEEEIK